MKLYETINEGNWMQGGLGLRAGKKCLGWHLFERTRDWNVIADVIKFLYPERLSSTLPPIVSFNNHPSTTLDDVIRVCKVADV